MSEQIPKILLDYLPILIFIIIAVGISIVVGVIPFILGKQRPDDEKLSQYECGFEPIDNAHKKFNIKFYLIAIIFIIFDLEIAFLFPWAITLGSIGALGFWSMMLFLFILTVGFIYEWRKGALNWE
jgi:NADH-quinone oxidoreductase subunit A